MRGVSWRPGCPVALRHLRLLALSYHSFRGEVRTGRLVANRDAAADLVRAFRVMFRHGYPIRRMRLVEHYGGSDLRSITANNTSAFNCRAVPGSGTWSEHAYGRAVDVNPVQNPYWHDDYVEPTRGRKFLDRFRRHPAMIHDGDAVVRVFDRLGWGWGGRWRSLKDWQHFSVTGR